VAFFNNKVQIYELKRDFAIFVTNFKVSEP